MLPTDHMKYVKNVNCATSEKSLTNLKHTKVIRVTKKNINSNRYDQKFKRNSKSLFVLNCIAFEWNWTNCLNCCVILNSVSFVLTLVLSVSKPCLRSAAVEIEIKHGEMAMTKTQTVVSSRLHNKINCIAMAIEYPTGFFTSNGNLCTVFIWRRVANRSANEIYIWSWSTYTVGNGNWKVSGPKSVVK